MSKVKYIKEYKRRRGSFGANVKRSAREFMRDFDSDNVRCALVMWMNRDGTINSSGCFEDRLQQIGAIDYIKNEAWDA